MSVRQVLNKRKEAQDLSREAMYDIISRPLITEKGARLSDADQVVFQVSLDATKFDVKHAVEELFSVKVESVRTLILKGKTKMVRGRKGRRSDIKKAYVRLAKGQKIDVTAKIA